MSFVCEMRLFFIGKERFPNVPCQKPAPIIVRAVTKTCARWKAFLEQSSQQRREKKRYLDYYNDLCSTIIRQCRSNNPYLSHRAS